MESLQKLKTEETKLQNYKTGVTSISVRECVRGVALASNPMANEYKIMIGKAISKVFFLHGKQFSPEIIATYLESIIETYKYETPETILLFLKKAANGDYGKFYGDPDIGTIREWFASFLGNEIVPERERYNTENKERYDSQREQKKSLREIIEGPPKLR